METLPELMQAVSGREDILTPMLEKEMPRNHIDQVVALFILTEQLILIAGQI